MSVRILWFALLAWALVVGCDRNMEPFVPDEKPRQPDLSKIFPAGAEQDRGAGQPAPSPSGGRGAVPIAGRAPIEGTVVLSEELADHVPANAVLFVIARKGAAGPPTAVKRVASPEFPLAFSIGPEDRMIQTIPFEGPLTVSVRIDADGNAMTREPGDLQGTLPSAVSPGARGLELVVDELL